MLAAVEAVAEIDLEPLGQLLEQAAGLVVVGVEHLLVQLYQADLAIHPVQARHKEITEV